MRAKRSNKLFRLHLRLSQQTVKNVTGTQNTAKKFRRFERDPMSLAFGVFQLRLVNPSLFRLK